MKRFNYDILSRTLTLWLNWIKVRLFENETGYDIQITLIIQPCYNLLTVCFFFGFTLPCFLLFEISWTVQVQWIIKTAERRIKREKEKNKKKKNKKGKKNRVEVAKNVRRWWRVQRCWSEPRRLEARRNVSNFHSWDSVDVQWTSTFSPPPPISRIPTQGKRLHREKCRQPIEQVNSSVVAW